MEFQIQGNLIYLCEKLSNLTEILLRLLRLGIISQDESDQITRLHLTPTEKNKLLLDIVQKKDWNLVGNVFLEILRTTNNQHCADKIEGKSTQFTSKIHRKHSAIYKWWPDKKLLVKSLHKRIFRGKLLVDELQDRILKDENRMVVLCESADAAKYSGMGGVGKTLTAKWYAHNYETEYDHILWIDCGEGSLVQSFKSLARDLRIQDRNELVYVEEFARKSFESLSEFKCLWIYDNAESYKGKEGIINVLPKEQENFFCLITSRSREWGVRNIGYGKISDLELDIFSEEESVEYLRGKLDEEIKCSDFELRELSRLLGNLPMAMELALASLNGKKREVKKYMKTLREKDLKVLDSAFDKYEETINKNIEISIEEILEEDEGKLTIEIFMIFGYIRPDDIPQQFIQQIFNSQVDKSIELLVRYSLISIQKKNIEIKNSEDEEWVMEELKLATSEDKDTEGNFLSIHRLLQQVIRHNGREKEREILKKIFCCEGFMEYKLIPFTKYAKEDLREEFPKIKAELLDQEQLKKLLKEKRFDESVELAEFIHQELKTNTSNFNCAICLDKNGQLEECVKTMEELQKENLEETEYYDMCDVEMGLLKLKKGLSRELVGGHLLLSYLKMDDKRKTQKILENRKQFAIVYSGENLDSLIRLVHSDLITSNYSLIKTNSVIELKLNAKIKKIELSRCFLSLNSFHRLSPTELTLDDVSFVRDGQGLEEVKVNCILDLTNSIKRLTIICDPFKKNVSLELIGDVFMDYVELRHVRFLNWNTFNWNVRQLHLTGTSYVMKANIKVQELTIQGSYIYKRVRFDSRLDVSCLPPTVQKLTLNKAKVFVSGQVELPKLNYLTLEEMNDVDDLSHFHSVPLTHIHLNEIREEVNVDHLPQTLTHLKMTKDYNKLCRIVGGVRKVPKLILKDFSFEQVEECLTHLQTDNLVVYCKYAIKSKGWLQLINKKINTIAVGCIKWDKDDFQNYSSKLDREAKYYFLEGGTGRAMDKKEFEELRKLF